MAEKNGVDSVERLRGDVAALQEQLTDLLKTASKPRENKMAPRPKMCSNGIWFILSGSLH